MLQAETVQTCVSIAYVGVLLSLATSFTYYSKRYFLSAGRSFLFFWLIFDALIHIFRTCTYFSHAVEGPFVYLSVNGRTVSSSNGFFASLWQEYSHADSRWGVADPGIVSIEALTVLLKGPLALYTAWLVLKSNEKYHIYLCFLCLSELYGDYMTFVPEWFTNTAALDTQDPLHLWFYLVISNGVWVVIPGFLLIQSTCALSRMVDAVSVKSQSSSKKAV